MNLKKQVFVKGALAFLSLFAAATVFGQTISDCRQHDPKAQYRDHPIDITRMKLEVSFEPVEGKVKGKVTHYFTPTRKKVDTLFFDAPGITIQSCLLNNKEVKWKADSAGLTMFCSPALQWEKNDSITIAYEATPRKGIYFIGWTDPNNMSRKQLWTQGEGTDNRFWIPMYDAPNDKYITETVITFDKDYNVLSNGTLLNGKKTIESNQPPSKPLVNKDGSTRTWHYRMQHPHAGYLLMLAIDKYAVKTFYSKSGVRICNWYYPEWEDRYQSTFKQTAQMMDFLEDATGTKFPWESYANVMVQDFMYGAMENTTATIFGDFYGIDARGYLDRNYNGVNCHEMTHQWFGDLITCEDWNDTWLQESFATFFPKLYTLKYLGEESYEWQRRNEQNSALDASKSNLNPIRNCDAGSARVYPKGSAVLDMLRHYVGEDAFKKCIQYYLAKNGYKNVNTNHFEQAFKDVLGIDLQWFFEEWIYRGGEPAYNITEQIGDVNKQQVLVLTVDQTHKTSDLVGLFKMPVVLEAFYTDGTKDSITVWVEKQSQKFAIPLQAGKQFSFALFDPGSWVIKTATFKKPLNELFNQLSHAPLMIDRYDALVALHDTAIDKKRNALVKAYNENSFQAIRSEIVYQLAKDVDPASMLILTKAFDDKDVNVRTSAVNNISLSTPAFLSSFEKALNDSSYNVALAALQKLVDANSPKADSYLEETKTVLGLNNSFHIKWLEIQASRTKGNEQLPYINELVAYTSNSYEFRTRGSAAASLKTLGYCDKTVVKNLFNGAVSSNGRLAGPCTTALDFFFAKEQYKPLIQQQYAEGQWKDWEVKILQKYK